MDFISKVMFVVVCVYVCVCTQTRGACLGCARAHAITCGRECAIYTQSPHLQTAHAPVFHTYVCVFHLFAYLLNLPLNLCYTGRQTNPQTHTRTQHVKDHGPAAVKLRVTDVW